MKRDGSLYTLLFAALVCFFCSAVVCSATVLLRSRQELNKVVDKQKKVLAVAGLAGEGKGLSAREVRELFERSIVPRLVELAAGGFAPEGAVPDVASYDQRRAREDPRLSVPAPPNMAQIQRLPRYALVYFLLEGGKVKEIILPVEGKGLWSTLYGFLALEGDYRTIRGITFYEHAETPGLGGEVDNQLWKDRWAGRLACDEKGEPRIQVKRGRAGSVAEDPYHVDGLSGATITSQGVSRMMSFWLGEDGFGPLLDKLRAGKLSL